MTTIDEKMVLTPNEKAFLKRVVNHWQRENTWLVCTGDSKNQFAGETSFTSIERLASRKLVINDLLEVKMLPSDKQLILQSNPRVNIGNSYFEIPINHPTNEQNFFDWGFKPTQKGMDDCFIEEL